MKYQKIIPLLGLFILVACTSPAVEPTPTALLTNTSIPTPSPEPTATLLPTPTPTAPPLGIGSTQISSIDGMEMVFIPAGTFLMGSDDPLGLNRGHAFELRPLEVVELDDFWIDRTEITNRMYKRCLDAGVCGQPIEVVYTTRDDYFEHPTYDNHPVFGVSWEDANKYCLWAGRHLANEAEWEKAARGWDGRKYPWGNMEPACYLAHYDDCQQDTLPVGSLPLGASPYGAMDMAGNVWEWVADWYPHEAYPTPFPLEGQEPVSETLHIVRGGSWANDSLVLESAIRFVGWPIDEISVGFGFRCALDKVP
jgi:formylglycine-generating enzyme required for sulfatase activity